MNKSRNEAQRFFVEEWGCLCRKHPCVAWLLSATVKSFSAAKTWKYIQWISKHMSWYVWTLCCSAAVGAVTEWRGRDSRVDTHGHEDQEDDAAHYGQHASELRLGVGRSATQKDNILLCGRFSFCLRQVCACALGFVRTGVCVAHVFWKHVVSLQARRKTKAKSGWNFEQMCVWCCFVRAILCGGSVSGTRMDFECRLAKEHTCARVWYEHFLAIWIVPHPGKSTWFLLSTDDQTKSLVTFTWSFLLPLQKWVRAPNCVNFPKNKGTVKWWRSHQNRRGKWMSVYDNEVSFGTIANYKLVFQWLRMTRGIHTTHKNHQSAVSIRRFCALLRSPWTGDQHDLKMTTRSSQTTDVSENCQRASFSQDFGTWFLRHLFPVTPNVDLFPTELITILFDIGSYRQQKEPTKPTLCSRRRKKVRAGETEKRRKSEAKRQRGDVWETPTSRHLHACVRVCVFLCVSAACSDCSIQAWHSPGFLETLKYLKQLNSTKRDKPRLGHWLNREVFGFKRVLPPRAQIPAKFGSEPETTFSLMIWRKIINCTCALCEPMVEKSGSLCSFISAVKGLWQGQPESGR